MADSYICPGCGEEVEVGSPRCETCDPPHPWEQSESLDGTGIPLSDDDFDYDEFIRDEFGEDVPTGHRAKKAFWTGIGIILLIALVLLALRGW